MFRLEHLPLIDCIPETSIIRLRLAQLVRERQLLMGLLRLSQQKREALERDQIQRKEGGQNVN